MRISWKASRRCSNNREFTGCDGKFDQVCHNGDSVGDNDPFSCEFGFGYTFQLFSYPKDLYA